MAAKTIKIQVPGMFLIGINVEEGMARKQQLESLRWVLGSWELAVRDTTRKGDRSREDVKHAIENVAKAIKPHLSPEEWQRFRFYLVNDDCTLDSLRGPNA